MTGRKTIAIASLAALAASASTATASKLISGSQIKAGTITGRNVKDGSLAGRDVKKGSVTLNRLSPEVRKLLAASKVAGVSGGATPVGQSGANGANGANGAKGADGKNGADGAKGTDGKEGANGTTGPTGPNGQDGSNGATGPTGSSGANPATPVRKDGDAGFKFLGNPPATFERGALHLHGGFDGRDEVPQGAPGLVKSYDGVPFGTLSATGYTFVDHKRGGTDKATIHVSVLGAVRGQDSKLTSTRGFTNFVYSPRINGLTDTRDATVDAFAPGNQWFSTGALPNASGSQGAPISIQAFQARNPDAKIFQISIDNGGSSNGASAPGDTDIAADNLILGFGDSFTRYDLGG